VDVDIDAAGEVTRGSSAGAGADVVALDTFDDVDFRAHVPPFVFHNLVRPSPSTRNPEP
jgi:hypothetical protein